MKTRALGAAGFLLLLLPAVGQDPIEKPSVSSVIDSAARGLPGQERPWKIVDDAEFLKRATQDLVGKAPAEADVKAFAADGDPNKRMKKINQFVDSDAFADFWARRFADLFLGDFSKVKIDAFRDLPGEAKTRIADNFRAWLRDQLKKDRPYTEIVQDMLDARGKTEGNPALAYKLSLLRGEETATGFAEGVTKHFLGIRLTCARCHDHPFDRWRVEDYYGLAAFNVRQRLTLYGLGAIPDQVEVKYADEGDMMIPDVDKSGKKNVAVNLADGGYAKPRFLFGGEAAKNDDRMKVLSISMTSKGNMQFPRALVNRVWGWLMGRGIVHPVDDFNLRNRPVSPALLDALARELQDNKYSIKRLVRAICASEVYQVAGVDKVTLDEEIFWHGAVRMPIRRYKPHPNLKPLAIAFEAPAAWIPDWGSMDGARAKYRVPPKGKTGKDAEFYIFDAGQSKVKTDLELWSAQVASLAPKSQAPKVETFEGKCKVTLHDLAGGFPCERGADGPLSYRFLAAWVDVPGGAVYLRLIGAAETVSDWREDFINLLKRVENKP